MSFFKKMLELHQNKLGNVSGYDFAHCYIGIINENNDNNLIIYGAKIQDYIFNKIHVENLCLIETCLLVFDGHRRLGNKYKITFNDGKCAELSIPAVNCKKFESVLL